MERHASSSLEGEAERSWVWHATVQSRAAGKVSVLAVVEALLAVAVYAGLAVGWGVAWPLLGSVFLAPVLLLRSPESVRLGVRWFLWGGFGVNAYRQWPKGRRRLCVLVAAVLGCAAGGMLAAWLIGLWQDGRTLGELSGWAVFLGCWVLAIGVGTAFAVAFLGAGIGAGVAVDAVGYAIKVVGAFVVAGVLLGGICLAFKYAVMDPGPSSFYVAMGGAVLGAALVLLAAAVILVAAVPGTALGLALRALVCRVLATLWHLPQGLRRLAENWQADTLLVDSCMPAELLPGLRPEAESLAPQCLVRRTAQGRRRVVRWVVAPGVAVLGFLVALVYRLQIKAACWFWWPLIYLLKPVPPPDRREARQQALCWPWADRWQRLFILVPALLPALLVGALLAAEFGRPGLWWQSQTADATVVPAPLQLVLGMQWRHVPPWHWALLLMQICGLGMLWIADGARTHLAKGTWRDYARGAMRQHLWRMRQLMRLRQVATLVFLLLGLGLCLVSFPGLRQSVPAPVQLRLGQLERFYRVGAVAGAAAPPLPPARESASKPAPTPASGAAGP